MSKVTTTTIQMLLSKIEAAHKVRDTTALESLFVHAYGLCGYGSDELSTGFEFLVSKLDIINKLGQHGLFSELLELGLHWATAENRASVWIELFTLGESIRKSESE
jgi:hypothetical protein